MKKKNKIIIRRIICVYLLHVLFINSYTFAQSYPPFTATVYDTAASTGYYFMSPKYDPLTGVIKETQLILDKFGEVIYYHNWPIGERASDFKMQPNGLMTFYRERQFFIMDSTFTVIDSVVRKNGLVHDEHDFLILPNGHFLMLAAELIQMDLSSYHIFKHKQIPGSTTASVRCNVIQEQDSAKNVVFEWHAKDYFSFADTDSAYLLDTVFVDWTHTNSVESDADGNLLISSRQFNEITKINRSDSSVIWRMGGSKNQFTFTNDSLGYKQQHDCRRIANGNITLFDNGMNKPFHPASAKEYKLDETQLTATLVWSYLFDSTMYSKSRGNVQRLPNGNTVIGYGDPINNAILFNCVDSLGSPIIDVRFADSLISYRVFNYPVLPWNINRPVISCQEVAGQIFLSVDSGGSSYVWNTGDTISKIQITDTGNYYVFVPRGNGGFLKSEVFVVSDFSNPCNLSSIADPKISDPGFSILSNPVYENVCIQINPLENQKLNVDILNIFGLKVYSSIIITNGNIIIPLSHTDPGVYFLRINGVLKKFIKI